MVMVEWADRSTAKLLVLLAVHFYFSVILSIMISSLLVEINEMIS